MGNNTKEREEEPALFLSKLSEASLSGMHLHPDLSNQSNPTSSGKTRLDSCQARLDSCDAVFDGLEPGAAPKSVSLRSLSEILDESPGPLSLFQALELSIAICEHLERRQVAHGDLRPKIIVFDDGQADIDDLRGGWLEPQIVYRAPEYRFGSAKPEADVFSIAVMLYEMLSNKTCSAAQICGGRNFLEPAKLSESGSWNTLPEQIRKIVLKGISRAPAFRYSSVAELNNALKHAKQKIFGPGKAANFCPSSRSDMASKAIKFFLLLLAVSLPLVLTVRHLSEDQSKLIVSPPQVSSHHH